MAKLTKHDLFWDMIQELNRVDKLYRQALNDIESGNYDKSLYNPFYMTFMQSGLQMQLRKLELFADTLCLSYLDETVDITKRLRAKAKLWQIANTEGINAATMWKLANG